MRVITQTALRSTLLEQGYVQTPVLLNEAELEELRSAVDRVFDACSVGLGRARWLELVNQVREPEQWDAGFASVPSHPRLLAVAEQALGRAAVPGWQHLVWRTPRCDLRLPWHTDRPTWPERLRDGEAVSFWLALDPSGPGRAGIHYSPRSHVEPATDETVCPSVPAGSALIHHADVMHASGANDTDGWRRALVMVFSAEE